MTLQQIKEKLQAEITFQECGEPNNYAKSTVLGLRYALYLVDTLIAEAEEHVTEGLYGSVGSDNDAYFHSGRVAQLRLTLGEKPE